MTYQKIPVVHVINSFQFGGAEAMLCNLLRSTDRGRFEPSVVSLIDDMTVAGPVIDAGIPITCVGMRPGVPDPRGVFRLAKHLRRVRPAIVQTWMDHSNLIGGLAARLASRKTRVVWGVHHSHHLGSKRSTLMTVAACARLSRWVPERVIVCSELSRVTYTATGFDASKLTVIPNGFDTSRFRPDPAARREVRAELGLPSECTLVGLAARYDHQKDPATFLRAAAIVSKRFEDVRFVVYGANMDRSNAELVALVESLGLGARLHLLGPRRDVQRMHAALDVAALSSVSEAFPLVLGEAMACGVACASTDVGDAALIVGDTGRIVPPASPPALADAISDLIAMGPHARGALGMAARRRVCELYDLTAVTRRYEAIYEELLRHDRIASKTLDLADGHSASPSAIA